MTPEERLREAEDTIEGWLCDLDAAHDGILDDARSTSATLVAEAAAEAAVVVASAKGQAAEVVAEADAEAARLMSAARDRAEEVVASAHMEAKRVLDDAREHAVRLTREVVDEIATIRRLTADAVAALPPRAPAVTPSPDVDARPVATVTGGAPGGAPTRVIDEAAPVPAPAATPATARPSWFRRLTRRG